MGSQNEAPQQHQQQRLQQHLSSVDMIDVAVSTDGKRSNSDKKKRDGIDTVQPDMNAYLIGLWEGIVHIGDDPKILAGITALATNVLNNGDHSAHLLSVKHKHERRQLWQEKEENIMQKQKKHQPKSDADEYKEGLENLPIGKSESLLSARDGEVDERSKMNRNQENKAMEEKQSERISKDQRSEALHQTASEIEQKGNQGHDDSHGKFEQINLTNRSSTANYDKPGEYNFLNKKKHCWKAIENKLSLLITFLSL
ncbi:hypothetical protein BCR41DRAFT_191922 [Lobosporangium transversale]|uniref:Uncharacterized protein n=1 Tax=Lobosporangium transversale TaxID=64571 RepID=A0A1Y2G9F7_9FUNG|nr:hypothetical protein BCR41DRAFT_191922 [Lobosporangium transversale]ORZ04821.1 hypothetical protein BCR41DRAFT_191922 [Lobosporangium transversale]|eukprot:XP_021876758.1 hypothetical protein BCR41DRAFT_191922 [Lobosporangium transversale]